MAKARSLHIVTLHGTWARSGTASAPEKENIPWFCVGSKFVVELQQALTAKGIATTVEAFEWTGANTLAARAEAGKSLATHLKALKRRTVLIAHSHGGNAALTALKDKAVPPTMLVTMATPFIKLQKNREGRHS